MPQRDIPSKSMMEAIRTKVFTVYPWLEVGHEARDLKMISYSEWRGTLNYHIPKKGGGADTSSVIVKATKKSDDSWEAYIEHGPDD